MKTRSEGMAEAVPEAVKNLLLCWFDILSLEICRT